MVNHPSIDLETFKWVKGEVDVNLLRAEEQVQHYVRSDDKVDLLNLVNHLHQVVGSLQMLELKSLSTLLLESEELVEDFVKPSSTIRKASFVVLVDSALGVLRLNLERIEGGQVEQSIEIVELVNQIRTVRGQDDIEISSLFSPNIEVFPQVNAARALRDKVYIKRAGVLRSNYQVALLEFLKDDPKRGAAKMRGVFDKVYEMSAFSSVARLWWVATSYADFLNLNDISNRAVHTRILRQIDDLMRALAKQGESALVSEPADELIKIMLFYSVAGEHRSDRMEEIVSAFGLQEYFGDPSSLASQEEINRLIKGLIEMSPKARGLVSKTRELVTEYFESESPSDEYLVALLEELQTLNELANTYEVDFLADLSQQAQALVSGIRSGDVIANDETGFHLASAIIFMDNSVSFPNEYDTELHELGQSKLRALVALSDSQSGGIAADANTLSSRDRKELLEVIGSEIESNLQDVEGRLEAFALDLTDSEQLIGIGDKITQVRGALQVLGEQKVGLLLTMAEQQFRSIERQEKQATPELVEALAISVGTMEEYVRGLKSGRVDMDYILDRSITDLEVAIGKRVMRADVESLLEKASGSLVTWLDNQGDFDLFNDLKSAHRDLTVLARKTKLTKVEHLIREQDRLINVISQEPAFLTDNIVSTLQHNMAEVTGLVIELYGTEESPEETSESSSYIMRSGDTKKVDSTSVQIHDDMDSSEVDPGLSLGFEEELSSTVIAKEHAAKESSTPQVNDAVFQAFIEECEELVDESRDFQRACEDNLDDRDAIRNLRRVFHTLKGSSRMVGLGNIGEIAWLCESMFNYVLDTGKPMTFSALAFAQKAIDEIDEHRRVGFKSGEKINITSWGQEAKDLSSAIDESKDAEKQKQAQPVIDLSDVGSVQTRDESDIDDDILDDDSSDDVLELSMEYSEDISLTDPLEAASNDFDEAESVMEIDLSDSELLDTDLSSLNLEDELSSTQDDDDSEESSYLSFQVIEDDLMREVFVGEAQESLRAITENTIDLGTPYVEDDALSICLHTLLGNANTLGLEPIANAYAQAEEFCHVRESQNAKLTEGDQQRFQSLVALTQEFLESATDQAPYFEVDEDKWQAQASLFHEFDADSSLEDEQSDLVGENANPLVNLAAINDELDLIGDKDSELKRLSESIDSELDDEVEYVDVSALLSDNNEIETTILGLDDELDGIESSIRSFRDKGSPEKPFVDDGVDEDDDVIDFDLETDDIEDEPILKPDGSLRKLVIPTGIDDLMNDPVSPEHESEDGLLETAEGFLLKEAEGSLSEEAEGSLSEEAEGSLSEEAEGSLLEEAEGSLLKEAEGSLLEEAEGSSELEDAADVFEIDEPQHAVDLVAPENESQEADSEYEGVDETIQRIFVEEMGELYNKLDQDIAELSDLPKAAAVMPRVMRHLHTIKGSALMAEATVLGGLTHSMESFLESNFIRDTDDVKHIQNTLEFFIDDLDLAVKQYSKQESFTPSSLLSERLGADLLQDALDASLEESQGQSQDADSVTSALESESTTVSVVSDE